MMGYPEAYLRRFRREHERGEHGEIPMHGCPSCFPPEQAPEGEERLRRVVEAFRLAKGEGHKHREAVAVDSMRAIVAEHSTGPGGEKQ